MSLLNCLSMIGKNAVTDILADYYKVNNIHHEWQMKLQQQQSSIDIFAQITHWVQEE